MIIRINKITSILDPSGPTNKYSAILVTNAGEACIAPAHKSFLYVSRIAERVRSLLQAKTPENIRIDYPEDVGIESRFDSFGEGVQEKAHACFPSLDDREEVMLDKVLSGDYTTAREREKKGLPFDPSGTLAGIKLQVRNVAERATLSDYEGFVDGLKRLAETLEDDVATRQEEEVAKVTRHAEFHAKIAAAKYEEELKQVEAERNNSLKTKLTPTEVLMIHRVTKYGGPDENRLVNIIERLAGDELQ